MVRSRVTMEQPTGLIGEIDSDLGLGRIRSATGGRGDPGDHSGSDQKVPGAEPEGSDARCPLTEATTSFPADESTC